MASFQIQTLLFILVAALVILDRTFVNASFNKNMIVIWGKHHVGISDSNLRLVLDETEGSAIRSKLAHLFGSVEMLIKLVPRNSAGIVTDYYLSSTRNAQIGFQFLGNSTGEPYTIQTNIYSGGQGGLRQEQFRPWFDPTSGFHNYTIHWNPSTIVWFVDGTPIRMFRNYETEGVPFPNKQGMKVFTRLWNADGATQGGRVKTNWTEAPFVVEGRRYKARACVWQRPANIKECVDPTIGSNWWTRPSFQELTKLQLTRMKKVRDGFLIYDYCKDVNRFSGVFPKECSLKQN